MPDGLGRLLALAFCLLGLRRRRGAGARRGRECAFTIISNRKDCEPLAKLLAADSNNLIAYHRMLRFKESRWYVGMQPQEAVPYSDIATVFVACIWLHSAQLVLIFAILPSIASSGPVDAKLN